MQKPKFDNLNALILQPVSGSAPVGPADPSVGVVGDGRAGLDFPFDDGDAITLDHSDNAHQQVYYVRLTRSGGGDRSVPWLFVSVDCKFRLCVSLCSPMTLAELRETIEEAYGGVRIVDDPLGVFPPGTECVPPDHEDECDEEDTDDFEDEGHDDGEIDEFELLMGPLDEFGPGWRRRLNRGRQTSDEPGHDGRAAGVEG